METKIFEKLEKRLLIEKIVLGIIIGILMIVGGFSYDGKNTSLCIIGFTFAFVAFVILILLFVFSKVACFCRDGYHFTVYQSLFETSLYLSNEKVASLDRNSNTIVFYYTLENYVLIEFSKNNLRAVAKYSDSEDVIMLF